MNQQHLRGSLQEATITVREGKSGSCISPHVLLTGNTEAESKSFTEVTLLAKSLS